MHGSYKMSHSDQSGTLRSEYRVIYVTPPIFQNVNCLGSRFDQNVSHVKIFKKTEH